MGRILAFTSGPQDWNNLLVDPGKQWNRGYSARTLAYCWEASDGFPPEVAKPFAMSNEHLLAELTPILAIPEFKVSLPGSIRASQNDIFVLARSVARADFNSDGIKDILLFEYCYTTHGTLGLVAYEFRLVRPKTFCLKSSRESSLTIRSSGPTMTVLRCRPLNSNVRKILPTGR